VHYGAATYRNATDNIPLDLVVEVLENNYQCYNCQDNQRAAKSGFGVISLAKGLGSVDQNFSIISDAPVLRFGFVFANTRTRISFVPELFKMTFASLDTDGGGLNGKYIFVPLADGVSHALTLGSNITMQTMDSDHTSGVVGHLLTHGDEKQKDITNTHSAVAVDVRNSDHLDVRVFLDSKPTTQGTRNVHFGGVSRLANTLCAQRPPPPFSPLPFTPPLLPSPSTPTSAPASPPASAPDTE